MNIGAKHARQASRLANIAAPMLLQNMKTAKHVNPHFFSTTKGFARSDRCSQA